MPEEDRYAYAEGLRQGGYLLSVRTSPAKYETALDLLEGSGAVNMDEREAQWRAKGWSSYQPGNMDTSRDTVIQSLRRSCASASGMSVTAGSACAAMWSRSRYRRACGCGRKTFRLSAGRLTDLRR
jgi:hypothetical protein